jgi:hypothetical protein
MKKLTDQELNIAIAEACGWTELPKRLGGWHAEDPRGQRRAVPYYATDLNAMHEAEEVLNKPVHMQKHAWNNYAFRLDEMTKGNAFHATARHRAEAFYITVCKPNQETE